MPDALVDVAAGKSKEMNVSAAWALAPRNMENKIVQAVFRDILPPRIALGYVTCDALASYCRVHDLYPRSAAKKCHGLRSFFLIDSRRDDSPGSGGYHQT